MDVWHSKTIYYGHEQLQDQIHIAPVESHSIDGQTQSKTQRENSGKEN
jgi:hypothetical protein